MGGALMLTDLKEWFGLLAMLLSIGGIVYSWLTSGSKKANEDLDAYKLANGSEVANLRTKLIEHDRRIQSVEGELKHLPDRDMAHRLELAVEKMNGRLDTMAETLKPIRATTERLNELLVEQAKK